MTTAWTLWKRLAPWMLPVLLVVVVLTVHRRGPLERAARHADRSLDRLEQLARQSRRRARRTVARVVPPHPATPEV